MVGLKLHLHAATMNSYNGTQSGQLAGLKRVVEFILERGRFRFLDFFFNGMHGLRVGMGGTVVMGGVRVCKRVGLTDACGRVCTYRRVFVCEREIDCGCVGNSICCS